MKTTNLMLCLASLLLASCSAQNQKSSDNDSDRNFDALKTDPIEMSTGETAGIEADNTDIPDSSAPKQQAPATVLPDSLTFAFAGDIMMGSTYPEVQLTSDDGASIFKDVAPILSSADIAAANLEGVLLDGRGVPKNCNGSNCYTFKMPERYVKHLLDAGIDFVSIANNHVNDFGAPGLQSTQKVLKEAGLPFAGLKESCPTAIIEKNGFKIGFTAFDHAKGTLSVLDLNEVRRVVKDLKEKCDLVVVSFHGGAEGSKYNHVPHAQETFLGMNRGNVEAFAHAAIDSGADIVYGHGPHVTRALELYKDRLIMYSLGNFATPYGMNLQGINSHAPVVTVTIDKDGKFRNGQIHSFIQTRGVGPRMDSTGTVAENMRELTQSDFPATPLKISPTGALTK